MSVRRHRTATPGWHSRPCRAARLADSARNIPEPTGRQALASAGAFQAISLTFASGLMWFVRVIAGSPPVSCRRASVSGGRGGTQDATPTAPCGLCSTTGLNGMCTPHTWPGRAVGPSESDGGLRLMMALSGLVTISLAVGRLMRRRCQLDRLRQGRSRVLRQTSRGTGLSATGRSG